MAASNLGKINLGKFNLNGGEEIYGITVSDAISVSESAQLLLDPTLLSLSDAITASESVVLSLSPLIISTQESIGVADSLAPLLEDLTRLINVSDAVTVAESLSLLAENRLSVFESISVTDGTQMVMSGSWECLTVDVHASNKTLEWDDEPVERQGT